jgi:Domain of unknown function (DUF4386)
MVQAVQDLHDMNNRLARIAGILYLILLPTTGPAYYSGQLAIAGDAATTLANIQANRTLFELLIVVGVLGFVVWLAMGVVFHRLFSPVSKIAANLLLAFVACSALLALAALGRRMDVLSLIHSAPAHSADQLQNEVVQTLHSSNNLMVTSVLFWGLWLFPFAWLVLRSGYAPRVLGMLMLLGGVWYVVTFVGTVFNPDYQDTLFARIIGIALGIPGTIGELGTALWLLIKGARTKLHTTSSVAAAGSEG